MSGGTGMTGRHLPPSLAIKDEWLTPPAIIRALGDFDLDPCSPVTRPWPTAARHYTIEDNGLLLPWMGRVWLNPPYGNETRRWLGKLAEHGDGVALIFARTETSDWDRFVWGKATAILFLAGRLHFHHVSGARATGNSGAPSALIAYGDACAAMLAESGLSGAYVSEWREIGPLDAMAATVGAEKQDDEPGLFNEVEKGVLA